MALEPDEERAGDGVCLLVACLTSQQHTSVSQGRICTDNFTCCHTETEVADPISYLTQSQYADTRPTSPSADPIMLESHVEVFCGHVEAFCGHREAFCGQIEVFCSHVEVVKHPALSRRLVAVFSVSAGKELFCGHVEVFCGDIESRRGVLWSRRGVLW